MFSRRWTAVGLILCLGVLTPVTAWCQETEPRLLRGTATPTFNSVGLAVDYDGNLPEGVACEVHYRKQGTAEWKKGLDLILCPQDKQFRGSLLNVVSNTVYEVECRLVRPADATGSPLSQLSLTAQTWPEEVPVGQVKEVPENSGAPLVIRDQGKADAWVVYRPAEGKTATINPGMTSAHAVVIEKASYVVLENVTVRGGQTDGVMVTDSHHVRIRRCDIAGWGDPGVKKTGLSKGLYVDSNGKLIDGQAGVRVAERTSQVVVENNFIHDPRGTANSWTYQHPNGPVGVLLWCTDGNNVVRNNDIIGSEDHWWNDAISSYPNNQVNGGPYRDSDICGNVLCFSNDDGAELDGGQINIRFFENWVGIVLCGVSGAPNLRGPAYIFRNLLLVSGEQDWRGGVGFKMGAYGKQAGTAVIAHNTVVSKKHGFGGNYYGAPAGEKRRAGPILMRNNIFVCRQKDLLTAGYGPGESEGDFDYDLVKKDGIDPPIAEWEKHGVIAAPNFRNAAAGDYRLLSDSPGVDAGVVLPSLNENFAGRAPDLGAFEHGPDESMCFPRRHDGLSVFPLHVSVDPATGQAGAGEISLSVPPSAGSRWTAHVNNPHVHCEPASGSNAPGSRTIRLRVDDKLEKPANPPYRAAVTFRTDKGYNRTVMVEVQFTPPAEPAASAPAEQNLIVNGGFEDGLEPWSKRDKGEITSETAHGGKQCVMMSHPGDGNGYYFAYQKPLKLEAGATYRLTAWIKTKGLPAGSETFVRCVAEPSNTMHLSPIVKGEADWTKVEVEMTLKAGDDRIGIYARCKSPAEGSAYLDDVSLVKLAQ
ncbi:MAG TPA: hypothetical protein DCX07_14025 [Phycisphaerales bacterium]|nr:hypothetical protein [Phycisphaerales bacterium]